MHHEHTPEKPQDTLTGNAWIMPSPESARAVYQTLLSNVLLKRPEDWSLTSGYFNDQPVLVFLWEPALSAEVMATVTRVVTTAGGKEVKGEARESILVQIRGRRKKVMDHSPVDTVVMRHSKGKVWWEFDN